MRLVSGFYDDAGPFTALPGITDYHCARVPKELEKGDVLVIWGGGDISPSLYNRRKSQHTWAEERPSIRDTVEWALMKQAVKLDVPIMGVCRGAQMACALAGGFLIQHVNNHSGDHIVQAYDGSEFYTNSIHHQMMYPWDVEHEMLCSIKDPLSLVHYDVNTLIEVKEEPEFVYFPTIKAFAVQWHPEAMDEDSAATQFVFNEFAKRF